MRTVRLSAIIILIFSSVCLWAQSPGQQITLSGKLVRAMAIGGESTGWVIELESAATVDGKQVNAIQVSYLKTKKLEQFENKHVTATGEIGHRHGVESGEQPVLNISSIKESPAPTQQSSTQSTFFDPSKSQWLLEDLNGSGVLDNVQATLTFPEAGKVAGFGSCNRYFGPAEIKDETIKLGPLASTRMACPEAVMNQEAKYLEALQAAEHFEWKESHLLVYTKGHEKPLRFSRMAP